MRKIKGDVIFVIEEATIVSYLTYVFGATVINYFLLPKFFYTKKYVTFFISVGVVITTIIIFEELVLEPIYYPTTRAIHFPGILFNLLKITPTLVAFVGFKFAWDATIKQRELEQLQNIVKESELQFLKSQINPHFLFNNLNNLYSYALEESPKMPKLILELSGVLRYMLYDCKSPFVPLDVEIQQLENFIHLNELQIEERGYVSFEKGEFSAAYQIAPLILTVFVENAFKHSSSSQENNIEVMIKSEVTQEGNFIFTCENTFGKLSNTTSLSKGIGLENVKKRLALIYPNAHQLDIDIQESRFNVYLIIDLKNSQE